MTNYHANFCVLGEVIEIQVFRKPARTLLIDISADPGPDQDVPDFLYRTSFSATDPGLISKLMDQVSQGDVIEATGSFWQLGYVPHRNTGYIDTTFRLSGFRMIRKQPNPGVRPNPYQGLLPHLTMH